VGSHAHLRKSSPDDFGSGRRSQRARNPRRSSRSGIRIRPLFVVATRQQHSLIARLSAPGRPAQKSSSASRQIVERPTIRRTTVAFDWSNTLLGSAGPISISGAPPTDRRPLQCQRLYPITAPTSLGQSALSTALGANFRARFPVDPCAIAQDQTAPCAGPVISRPTTRGAFQGTTEQPFSRDRRDLRLRTAATSSSIRLHRVGTP